MSKTMRDMAIAAAICAAAVAAAFWSPGAQAQTLGLNLVTAHASGGFRSWTPGMYARSDDGLTAGVLRNSEGSWGAHVSQTWRVQPLGVPIDLTAGAITGYRRALVLPLATASVLLGQTRLVWIPGSRGGALHVAGEF
jgi:hypothetical protein